MPLLFNYPLSPKIFQNKLFNVQLSAMRISGHLMVDKKPYRELWHILRSAFFTLSVAVCCILQFGKPFKDPKNRDAMGLATAFQFLTTVVALFSAFFRRRRLAKMLIFLQDDLDRLLKKSDEREKAIFERSHRYMFIITCCIWIPSMMAGLMAYVDAFARFIFFPESMFNLENVRNGTDTHPLLLRLFPFREVSDDLFVGYFLPLYALFLGIIAIPLWHTFITGLMTYLIYKYKILHKRLSEMDISKVSLNSKEYLLYSKISNENEKRNFLRMKLCKCCVVEQIRIRWFVNELRQLIGLPVFSDFIIFSVLICFLFYEMASGNLTKMDSLFMTLYLFVMSSILWLYHWHATVLMEHNQAMATSIYCSNWYNYSIKVQKMIQMVIIISKNQLEIKAVLVPLSLKTFLEILRAAYSYFSLLRNLSP